jgi:Xaa-Pro aminopeptidase
MFASTRTVPIPPFPTLPQEEYEDRYRRVREAMERDGIDLLLVTEQENVEYLSGYLSSHWFMHGIVPGIVLLPLYGEPCIILPNFWLGTAQKKSWIQEIHTHTNTHSMPDSLADLVVEVIRKHNWQKSVIGYEAGQEMTLGVPIQQFDAIRSGLASATWLPGGESLWAARMLKSSLEISLLSEAAKSSCRALDRVRVSAQAGMRESDIGRLIRLYQIEEGCEDRQFLNVRCGPPRYSMTDTLPEDRLIQPGEMMILDVGMQRKCYWSDTARCAAVGKPPNLYLETYEVILEAQQSALSTLSDGIPASVPYHAARKILDKAGTGVHIDMMGHGIGMSMYEPPMLSPVSPGTLRAGMVLCVEPWITLPDDGGVFCLEETVLVTQDGYQKLTNWDSFALWVIESPPRS